MTVMSLAPGVGSHTSVVCLQTRVSLGNWPMFDTKSRKYCTHPEGPAGTEYLNVTCSCVLVGWSRLEEMRLTFMTQGFHAREPAQIVVICKIS